MKRGLGWRVEMDGIDGWMGKEMDGEMDGRWMEMEGWMEI